jgi:5-methylcytosine-specific restriction endonuclease McrA
MRRTKSARQPDQGQHGCVRREASRARIAKAQGRSVAEWIGKTPDATPPAGVRLRILRRFDRKCQLTGIIIADGQPFDLEHEKPLEEGGENRERNLVPVLRLPHEVKTAAEKKRQAKADRIAKQAHHLRPAPKKKIQSRGFDKVEKLRKIDKSLLGPLGLPAIARRYRPSS